MKRIKFKEVAFVLFTTIAVVLIALVRVGVNTYIDNKKNEEVIEKIDSAYNKGYYDARRVYVDSVRRQNQGQENR